MPSNNLTSDDKLKKFLLKKSSNSTMAFLDDRDKWLERDLLNIANVVFNIEKLIKNGQHVGKVVIPLSPETISRVDLVLLQNELEDLLLYVLIEKVEIGFSKDFRIYPEKRSRYEPQQHETVSLFSGGVDSYSGILNWAEKFQNVAGIAVIHGDQPWGSNIIDKITSRIGSEYEISFHKMYAPRMTSTGYSQLRGVLYSLYAGIYLNMMDARTLLISEVGPTMYQPRFSPYDSVTMTTHPFVLKKVKRILKLMLDRDFKIAIPFENMTKAEVAAASPLKEGLPLTHSCISLRFGRSDGTCYGCTIRRLGLLVAGVPDTEYLKDPIGDKEADADNISSLVRFSYDILTNFGNMLDSATENIVDYGKRDLFKRFSLDTFAGLYLYQSEIGPLNPYLEAIYKSAVDRLTQQRLEKRIAKVRRPTFKPNFSKTV